MMEISNSSMVVVDGDLEGKLWTKSNAELEVIVGTVAVNTKIEVTFSTMAECANILLTTTATNKD